MPAGLNKNAIGFFLSLEDELTPALAKAEKKYASFISKISALNDKASDALQAGMSSMSGFVNSFTDKTAKAGNLLPKGGKSAATGSSTAIKVAFDDVTMAKFWKAGGQLFVRLLQKTKFTFMAGTKKTVLTLANLPKFAKGGIIGAPGDFDIPNNLFQKGDDQIIGAKTGELVTPAEDLKTILATIERLVDKLVGLTTGQQRMLIWNNLPGGMGLPRDFKLPTASAVPGADANHPLFVAPAKAATIIPPAQPVGTSTLLGQFSIPAFKEDMVKGLDFVIKMDDKTKELEKDSAKVKTAWQEFFEKILGPARFLAINAALGKLQEGFAKLKSAGQATFSVGAGKVDDFVTNMNRLNKNMGLTRAELRDLKTQVVSDAQAMGGAFDLEEYSAAFAALREAGQANKQMLRDLTPAVAALGSLGDSSAASAATYFEEIRKGSHLTKDAIVDLSANIVSAAQISGESLEELLSASKQDMGDLLSVFAEAGPKIQAQVLTNAQQMRAALESQAGRGGVMLFELMKGVAKGDPDAFNKMAMLSGVTSQAEMMEMFQTKKGLGDMLANIQRRVASVGTGMRAQALSQSVGIEPGQFVEMSQSLAKVIPQLTALEKGSVKAGEGEKFLIDKVKDAKTWFTKFINAVANGVEGINFLPGAKVIELVDLFHEIGGFQTLHSVVYLSRSLWDLGSALLKMSKIAPAAATGIAAVATAERATAAAGVAEGVGAGVGVESFLTGLATGLAAFANPYVLAGTAVVTGALSVLILAVGKAAKMANEGNRQPNDMGLGNIKSFVKGLKEMAEGDITDAKSKITAIADMMGSFGEARTKLMESSPGAGGWNFVLGGPYMATYLDSQRMWQLRKSLPDMIGTFRAIRDAFAKSNLRANSQSMQDAVAKLKAVGEIAMSLGQLSEGLAKATDISMPASGWDWSRPFKSMIDELKDAVRDDTFTKLNKLLKPGDYGQKPILLESISTVISAFSNVTWTQDNATLAKNNINAAASVMSKMTLLLQTLVQTARAAGRLQSNFGDLQWLSKNAPLIQSNIAAIGKINPVSASLTPGQINQAIAVTVQGKVEAFDEETHNILNMILVAVQGGGKTPATGTVPSAPSPAVTAFGSGRLGP